MLYSFSVFTGCLIGLRPSIRERDPKQSLIILHQKHFYTMKRKILVTENNGHVTVMNTYAAALRHYGMFNGNINKYKAIKRLLTHSDIKSVTQGEGQPQLVEPMFDDFKEVEVEEVETQSESEAMNETEEQQESETEESEEKEQQEGNDQKKEEETDQQQQDLFQALKTYIDSKGGQQSETENLEQFIADRIKEELKSHTKTITLKLPDGTTLQTGKQHKCFPILLQVIAAGINAYLVGPAGSFKTTAAKNVAETLKKDYYPVSVGPQTTKSDLFGYMDANGNYVKTAIRDAYENGGILLLDELDAGNPGVITQMNNLLDGEICVFPDKVTQRHADFICIAAANTFGTGASRQYVGRNQLDAASLDRFAFIDWPYDEALERELTGNDSWFNLVVKYRHKADKQKMRVVISPRASFFGAKLLATGLDLRDVEKLTVFKGLKEDQVKTLKAA